MDKDVNQTRVSFGLRALDRYDPDFPAAQVMNYILGGGGFTSRLVNRIRSDEGLAYTVRSRLEGGTYYAGRLARRSSRPRRARPRSRISIGADRGRRASATRWCTTGELETAKNTFIEGFPAPLPDRRRPSPARWRPRS